MNKKIAVLYMPVLHEGYVRFLQSQDFEEIYILGEKITNSYRDIVKDIRAVSSQIMVRVVKMVCPNANVYCANDEKILYSLNKKDLSILMPDEKLSIDISKKYLLRAHVELSSIFLRWDSINSIAIRPIKQKYTIKMNSLENEFLLVALDEAEKSSDWWRQVGAVLVCKDGFEIVSHNQHVPNEQTPYINGDPRSSFNKGINIENSTSLHAEMNIISHAVREGINLSGAKLFVTTFPCAWCAKILAFSGIEEIFYIVGYSNLDAESILLSQNIKLIKVEI